KGTLSASKNEQGKWVIQPIELFRVYKPKPMSNDTTLHDNDGNSSSDHCAITKNSASQQANPSATLG
ncbi:MAG: DNA-binding protein, partial [Burkholderiaceae bacterium]|nr:DNA-binding protein [Burkholderiaceae bacterium]